MLPLGWGIVTPSTSVVPPLDVVVVTYNPGSTLGTFLDSVPGAGAIASVIVVDSASPERTAREVARERKVRFHQMPQNLGYGAAANAGVRRGSAPWIAVCNADIEFDHGSLLALVRAGDEDPMIAAVGPRILEPDGQVYPSARPLPSLWLGAGHAIFGRVWSGNPWSTRYRTAIDPNEGAKDVGWLSGSCLVVRREAFEAVGGFDEGFFMFMEDVDLCRRLGQRGFRCRWVPEAIVTHLGGHTWRADPAPMIRAHHESATRYVSLVYPHWYQAPLRAALGLGLRLRERSEVAAARRARAD
jgi:N-acetylglucosaminyl-diphospho-decaprenol L-rhamnosyltransferase